MLGKNIYRKRTTNFISIRPNINVYVGKQRMYGKIIYRLCI